MKKLLLFTLFLLLVNTQITAQEKSDIALIREELFYTDFDIEQCLSFYNTVAEFRQITATMTAYEAVAMALIAKHSWNPVTKYSYLKDALALLNKAVDLDKMNLEIRFLRLYIENSLPSYLGAADNMKTDKQLIIENIHLLDASDLNPDIIQYILSYMSTSVTCTQEEMKIIQARMY